MVDVNASRAPADRWTNVAACAEIGRVVSALNLGGPDRHRFPRAGHGVARTAVTDALREALTHAVCETDVEPVNHLGVGLVTLCPPRLFWLNSSAVWAISKGSPVALARQAADDPHG